MQIRLELIRELHTRLLAHFDRGHRDLPWRRDRNGYRVWVSEIMLQQTRVDTVVPYFQRWMERYPTVVDLAEASVEEVLKSWEGLGYYSRARNLHRAAGLVREELDGEMPRTSEELRRLPGIGEYTSGAIASLAFGERVSAVDGNVRRVLSRWFDLEDPSATGLKEVADALVHDVRPGDWNEALMEFGATQCVPRVPDCEECPLRSCCAAFAAGTVELRPPPKRKTRQRDARFEVVVPTRADGDFLIVRRPESGLLGGMWEFPQLESGEDDRPSAVRAVLDGWGLTPVGGRNEIRLEDVPHVFTHIRATYRSRVVWVEGRAETDETRWVHPTATVEYPMPVAQQRIRSLAADAVGRLDSPPANP